MQDAQGRANLRVGQQLEHPRDCRGPLCARGHGKPKDLEAGAVSAGEQRSPEKCQVNNNISGCIVLDYFPILFRLWAIVLHPAMVSLSFLRFASSLRALLFSLLFLPLFCQRLGMSFRPFSSQLAGIEIDSEDSEAVQQWYTVLKCYL